MVYSTRSTLMSYCNHAYWCGGGGVTVHRMAARECSAVKRAVRQLLHCRPLCPDDVSAVVGSLSRAIDAATRTLRGSQDSRHRAARGWLYTYRATAYARMFTDSSSSEGGAQLEAALLDLSEALALNPAGNVHVGPPLYLYICTLQLHSIERPRSPSWT